MSLSFPALTLVPPLEDEPAGVALPAPHSQTVVRAAACSLRDAVREHHAFVWRSVRRLGVPETDVEDAAQRVFLVLAKNLEQVDPAKLRSYLFGVAMRVAANERRAAKARAGRSTSDGDADRVPCGSTPADEALDRRRARVLLDEILDDLDEDLRSVFVLHELEHMTMADIAEVLAIPAGTAASRLRRARAEIEQHALRLRAKMNFLGGSR
jgi:RNA polymerase sigma-70 factor (ECF subfamily)